MPVLVDGRSRIIVQGITGRSGSAFAERMLRGGTPLVGGVAPGRGGQSVHGIPVFDTVAEARQEVAASCSLIVVPAPHVRAAFEEAAAAGLELASVYSEKVPAHDAAAMIATSRRTGIRLIGPNAAGVVSPGLANLSDLKDENLRPGHVGIVSKSGTLTYQVISDLHDYGLGESTIICLGGDPLVGTSYSDVLRLLAEDRDTHSVVLLGEIGGKAEILGGQTWMTLGSTKPLVAYIAGWAAPPGKRMGHAGAILGQGSDGAAEKSRVLAEAGAQVVELVTEVGRRVALALDGQG